MDAVKRLGRPPLDADDDSVKVNVTIPAKAYDKLFERAQRARCSVPAVIRAELAAADRRRQDEPDEK